MNKLKIGVVVVILLLGLAMGQLLRPDIKAMNEDPNLAEKIPAKFGVWTELPNALEQITTTVGELSREQPYDEIVSKTYVDNQGHSVMLTVAYGKNQRQEIKIHRPELCYPAQGFQVKGFRAVDFDDVHSAQAGLVIPGKRMVAAGKYFDEIVSYWIRIGSTYSSSAWETRWTIMKEGLAGRMADGVLVRVSQRIRPGEDPENYYIVQERFMKDLVDAVGPDVRNIIAR